MPNININIERWPESGVFTTPEELATALKELNDKDFRGSLQIGDGVQLIKEWQLTLARGSVETASAGFGQVLVYYMGTLRSFTVEEYTEMTGEAP